MNSHITGNPVDHSEPNPSCLSQGTLETQIHVAYVLDPEMSEVIESLAQTLGFPREVTDEALSIYKTCRERWRGYDFTAVAAASLFVAVRRSKCEPLSLRKFVDVVRENTKKDFPLGKDIARMYRKIMWELGFLPKTCTLKPSIYALDIARKLGMSIKARHKVEELTKMVEKANLHLGKHPLGLASGICYLAGLITGDHRAQREIAELVHVTEPTIQSRYKELVEGLGLKCEPRLKRIDQELFKKLVLQLLNEREKSRPIHVCNLGSALHRQWRKELRNTRILSSEAHKPIRELVEAGKIRVQRWNRCNYPEIPCPCRHCTCYEIEKLKGITNG